MGILERRKNIFMFDMKPEIPESTGGDNVSAEAWTEWNNYYYGLLDVAEKPSTNKDGEVKPNYFHKKKTVVGIANLFVDCGLQPQQDAQYKSKVAPPAEGEEYSAEELAHIEKYPSNDFVWKDGKVGGERIQTAPVRPTQEYAIFFDFPSIVVDWTKHPIEALHSLGQKPLRISYNGYMKWKGVEGFAKRLAFDPNYKTKLLSTKSPLYKLSEFMGVEEDYVSSGYNLAKLAGKAVKFEVVMEKNTYDGREYYSTVIKNPSKIEAVEAGDVVVTVEQQIPQCDIEPQSVPLNLREGQSYDEVALGTVKHDRGLKAVLPRMVEFKPSPEKHPDFVLGIKFDETMLSEKLGEFGGNTPVQASSNQSGEDKTSKVSDSPTKGEKVPEKTGNASEKVDSFEEPEIDFDDSIPF